MGRYYTIASYSVQRMRKLLRRTLIVHECHDSDMVNADPRLLDQLRDRLAIKHPALKQYVKLPSQTMMKIIVKSTTTDIEADDVTYDKAKQKVLIVMYGGYVATIPKIIN